MTDNSVLVIGPRLGLIDVLRAQSIPFSIWQENNTHSWHDAQSVVVAPLWNSSEKLKQQITKEFANRHFTHVIAGTEAAVYPAAIARRMVGARLSKTTTALRCRDKLAMKEYLCEFGIPMTRFLSESSVTTATKAFAFLGSPLVRKSRKSSGGRGLEIIHDASDLVLHHGGRNILEKYIDAPEASIESFINHREIRFTNITRYVDKGHVNFVPAGFDQSLTEDILALNRRVIEALNISWGVTHLEVYLTQQGLLFGEIALRPPGGYIMPAMKYAYDFNPWEAFVAMELDQQFHFPGHVSQYAAVQVFHPGPGVVTSIHGESELRDHPGVRRFRLKISVGDNISKRASVGQDTGYLIHATDTPAAREELHQYISQHFVIQMSESDQ